MSREAQGTYRTKKQTNKKKETQGAWNSSNIQGRPNFIVLRSAQKHYYCPSQFN